MYRAISEGVINLADCFFDMEYLDASKGLEIYKQSIADNERLSNFYAQVSTHAVLSLANETLTQRCCSHPSVSQQCGCIAPSGAHEIPPRRSTDIHRSSGPPYFAGLVTVSRSCVCCVHLLSSTAMIWVGVATFDERLAGLGLLTAAAASATNRCGAARSQCPLRPSSKQRWLTVIIADDTVLT